MARGLHALIFAAALPALAAAGDAGNPAAASPAPPNLRRPLIGSPDFQKAREAMRELTPEERKKWIENFRRWQDLPPPAKQALLDRQEQFQKRMREDLDNALKQSGLQLNDEQRKRFAERYTEERRRIEEDLRRQMEEQRRPRVDALVEKLKLEFSAPSAPK